MAVRRIVGGKWGTIQLKEELEGTQSETTAARGIHRKNDKKYSLSFAGAATLEGGGRGFEDE